MMLNSDQTVQELIEEHKKKQSPAEGGAGGTPSEAPPTVEPEAPLPPKTSVAPLSGLPGAPKSVLAPPRAAMSKRRMGGTMLGVAPPAGGVTPPQSEVTATPPQVNAPGIPSTEPPSAPVEPLISVTPAQRKPAAPLAATVGMPVVSVQPVVRPSPWVPAPGGTRPLAVIAEPIPRAAAAGGTRPLAAAEAEAADPASPRDLTPLSRDLAPAPHDLAPVPPPPEATPAPRDLTPAAPREVTPESLVPTPRVPAVTAPLPQHPLAAAAAIADPTAMHDPGATDEAASLVAPRGVKPFEVFLIVATCGLYGLVLLMRQRKPS